MKLITAIGTLLATTFFNTNAGSKLYICATNKENDLDQAEFEALTWVEIGAVGSAGEAGTTTNMLNYPTWDTEVTQKAKGISDGGSPDIEVARDPDDAGQILLRAAAATNLNWAFKEERNDKPNSDADSKPTIYYTRGLVNGPRRPRGRNEDFDIEVFTLGLQQKEIRVDPVDGTAP